MKPSGFYVDPYFLPQLSVIRQYIKEKGAKSTT